MRKVMTISYQYRGNRPMASKLVIANHLLKKFGFLEGAKIEVLYTQNQLIITKINLTNYEYKLQTSCLQK